MNKVWFTFVIKGSVKNSEKLEAACLELFALIGSYSSKQEEDMILSYDSQQNFYDWWLLNCYK